MSDLDAAVSRRRRRKVVAEEPVTPPVTQEVTPESVKVIIQEPVSPEPKLTARTVAEIERGRRALAEIAKQRAGK